MKSLQFALGIGPLAGLSTGLSVQDLASSQVSWTLSSAPLDISVPGNVPSHTHLDLYAAGVIGDPYYGDNTFTQRWVTAATWTYTSSPLQLTKTTASTHLVFNGIDTFSNVSFCGQHVGSTENQFRQYIFDITDILSNCTGTAPPSISVELGSAPAIAEQTAKALNSPIWPNVTGGPSNDFQFQYPYREFIRKEGSDFGWDWGPAEAPAGIWQPAFLVQTGADKGDPLYVTNSLVDVYRLGQVNNLPPDQTQKWVVNASIDYIGMLPDNARITIQILDSNNKTFAVGSLANITTTDVAGKTRTIGGTFLVEKEPKLWWPQNLGPQSLYTVVVQVSTANGTSVATVEKRTGFRTIVLNMEPIRDDQLAAGVAPGNNWHFEINGHEFYAKGSNFIPPDAFWPRVTQARMEQLFDSVVAGNQNMLRVWATGAYLPDFIYDIADAKGVLLWSEFEFGDSLYPVNQEFLDNVREEAIYNVRRVNHHPSLALWAGGNEFENLVIPSAVQQDPANSVAYLENYEKLFLDVLLPVVYDNSRSISYTPTSSGNGYQFLDHSTYTMIERYNNVTAGSIYGDTDYYNYNSLVSFDYSLYPVGRFANEFGYHSMPSIQTWRQAIPEDELYFNSTMVLVHSNHYPPGTVSTTNRTNALRGQGEMTLAVQRYYPIPNLADATANFSAWCHTTQIFQADFYKSQIQFYRRGSGFPERQLGSLYWQLEDIWQAPTWAGIEYDGRWKVLHHVAKDIYQPVIIAPFFNASTGRLGIYVTSDLWAPAVGSATFTWYDWTGRSLGHASTVKVEVGALNTTRVLQMTVRRNKTFALDNAVLVMSVEVRGQRPNSGSSRTQTFAHQNWFHPVPLNVAKLVDPKIKLEYDASTGGFAVTSKAVAPWTWLDFPAGVLGNFDDNAFLLLPGQKKNVGFTLKEDTTGGAWKGGVTVRSLWNNTH